MNHIRLGIAVAAGLLSIPPAHAVEITGLGSASYVHASGGIDGYGGAAMALFSSEETGLKTQISGSYQSAGLDGVSVKLANFGGDLFWRDKAGAIGASVGYHRLSADASLLGISLSGTANVQSYGAFGEWYANKWLTLQVKGGGFGSDVSGGYAGAGFSFYPLRTLAWTATYDYLSFSHFGDMSSLSTGLEYLPMPSIPISIAAHYAYSWSGGANANTFGITLTFRVGPGGRDLRSWDRTGPTQWTGAIAI